MISNRSLLFLFALAAMWIIVMTTMNGVTSFLHGREVSHFEEAVQSKKPFPELITAYQNLLHVVGAKESQAELLKTLPSDPETHELDHETGAYLYKTFKEAGVHQCDKTFTGGCFHGFILALANTTGVDHIPEFVKICKSGMQGEQGWQCPHGAGHAFLVISGYTQLQKALEQC